MDLAEHEETYVSVMFQCYVGAERYGHIGRCTDNGYGGSSAPEDGVEDNVGEAPQRISLALILM